MYGWLILRKLQEEIATMWVAVDKDVGYKRSLGPDTHFRRGGDAPNREEDPMRCHWPVSIRTTVEVVP